MRSKSVIVAALAAIYSVIPAYNANAGEKGDWFYENQQPGVPERWKVELSNVLGEDVNLGKFLDGGDRGMYSIRNGDKETGMFLFMYDEEASVTGKFTHDKVLYREGRIKFQRKYSIEERLFTFCLEDAREDVRCGYGIFVETPSGKRLVRADFEEGREYDYLVGRLKGTKDLSESEGEVQRKGFIVTTYFTEGRGEAGKCWQEDNLFEIDRMGKVKLVEMIGRKTLEKLPADVPFYLEKAGREFRIGKGYNPYAALNKPVSAEDLGKFGIDPAKISLESWQTVDMAGDESITLSTGCLPCEETMNMVNGLDRGFSIGCSPESYSNATIDVGPDGSSGVRSENCIFNEESGEWEVPKRE